jgi:hypothetical protein
MTDIGRAKEWVKDNAFGNTREDAEQLLRAKGVNYDNRLWQDVLNDLYPESQEAEIQNLPPEQQAAAEVLADREKEREQEEANPIQRIGSWLRRFFRGQD